VADAEVFGSAGGVGFGPGVLRDVTILAGSWRDTPHRFHTRRRPWPTYKRAVDSTRVYACD